MPSWQFRLECKFFDSMSKVLNGFVSHVVTVGSVYIVTCLVFYNFLNSSNLSVILILNRNPVK